MYQQGRDRCCPAAPAGGPCAHTRGRLAVSTRPCAVPKNIGWSMLPGDAKWKKFSGNGRIQSPSNHTIPETVKHRGGLQVVLGGRREAGQQHKEKGNSVKESMNDLRRHAGSKSNVVVLKTKDEVTDERHRLEMEVKMLLKEDDSWCVNDRDVPKNIIHVTSPKHLKSLIMNPEELRIGVVVDFFAPSCNACKSMWPKLKQLASQNQEIVFAKVDTSKKELSAMAEGLNVPKLPWFLIFQGSAGDLRSSFTANLTTLDVLRAEISSLKECTDPHCVL